MKISFIKAVAFLRNRWLLRYSSKYLNAWKLIPFRKTIWEITDSSGSRRYDFLKVKCFSYLSYCRASNIKAFIATVQLHEIKIISRSLSKICSPLVCYSQVIWARVDLPQSPSLSHEPAVCPCIYHWSWCSISCGK